LKNYKLGIEDATSALHMISTHLASIPSSEEKNWPCDPFPSQRKVSGNDLREHMIDTRRDFLCLRGTCAAYLEDLDGALIDMRAVNASRYFDSLPASEDLIAAVLVLLAKKKAGSPRPYFSDTEIRSWNQELRIKEYSEENRACFNCGERNRKNSNSEFKLKLCGNCRKVWFCGTSCLKAGWAGHKPVCRSKVKIVTVIPIETEELVRSDITRTGHYVTADRNGPTVIVLDSKTGAFHEALSDQDVLFLPADSPAAIQDAVFRHHRERFTQ
jgi:hypothetical protein